MNPEQRAEFGDKGVRQMHICPECSGHLVQPVSWHSIAEYEWEVELRCPDCEWVDSDVYYQDEIDVYDDVLEDGKLIFKRTLQEITKSNMRDEIGRFTSALGADCILPEDF